MSIYSSTTVLFPQGERCSFSVQMWYYFLCGLRSDLWAVLPADVAKDVLGQVLSETLQLLVQRYARARPSYKRHLQIRYKIKSDPECPSNKDVAQHGTVHADVLKYVHLL